MKTAKIEIPVLGAIDLGTNSCRLLVAAVRQDEASDTIIVPNLYGDSGKIFHQKKPSLLSSGLDVIESFARVVRLGEGLHKTDYLSTSAIQRTIDVLKKCRDKMDGHGVSMSRTVATEACRQAKNVDVLLQRAKEEADIDIEIITAKEEARLALTGCAALLDPSKPYAVVFDVGGGSTEVTWLKIIPNEKSNIKDVFGNSASFEVIDSISIRYGVVMTSESYDRFADSPIIYENIRSSVKKQLKEFFKKRNIDEYLNNDQVQLLGSSGTVTTLAAMQHGMKQYEKKAVDGLTVRTEHLHIVGQKILFMSPSERKIHPCLKRGQPDLMVVGAAIVEGICDAMPVSELKVADRGVREGIISDLLINYHAM